jgi:PAS domain S-box-containing protein
MIHKPDTLRLSSIRSRYVFGLFLILLLSLGTHLLRQSILDLSAQDAAVINTSGRQRMLSQRIASHGLELAESRGLRDAVRSSMREAISLMERSHRALIEGVRESGTTPQSLSRIYFSPLELDRQVQDFLQHARRVTDEPSGTLEVNDPDLLALVDQAHTPLIQALDLAVKTYELESRSRIEQLERVETLAIALLILTIVLEAVFIFLPLERTLRRNFDQIAEREARFRATFDLVATGMALLDAQGRYLRVNKVLCAMLGYTETELLGRDPQALTQFEALDAGIELNQELLGGKIDSFSLEKRFQHKDGYEVWALVNVALVRSQDGASPYLIHQVQDISARKRAEIALLESQERFRGAFYGASTGMSLVSLEGSWIDFNDTVTEMLAYTREELHALSFQQITHPDDLEEDLRETARLLAGEIKSFSLEKRYLRRDGSAVWVVLHVALLCDANGSPVCFITHIKDITENKRAETALRESEERFRTALDASLDSFFVLHSLRDDSGRIMDFVFVEVNRCAEKMLRRSRAELIGARLCELFPANRTSGLFEQYLRVAETREPYEAEFETTTPGLSASWLSVQAVALKDGVVVTARDVSERKRAERALVESEGRFRALFEQSADGVVLIDPHDPTVPWRMVDCNQAFCLMNGYARDELLGQSIDLLHDSALMAQQGERLLAWIRAEVTGHGEGLHRRKDGSTFAIESASSIVTIGGRELVLGLDRDITERKRAEENLRDFAARLERSNRELQEFAYVASHDLQEPLRKVQAFGDRLKVRYSPALGPDGLDYLERMQGAAGRMKSLIQDLLSFSRVASQPQPFMEVDLDRVACEVLEDLEARLEISGGRVEIGPLGTIQADPTQMRQLLQNLIGNALKFHRADVAPVVKVYTRLVSKGAGKSFELCIEDNGIGFAQQHTERIFAPFQRLHGREAYEGTGMGLAICRRIVERHAGTMSAQSVEGIGSTFTVTLPFATVQWEGLSEKGT